MMHQSNDIIDALKQAKHMYYNGRKASPELLQMMVRNLNEYQLFSTGQLAQLATVSTSTLYNWGIEAPRKGSGKFNPMSIDTLIQLRLNLENGLPINRVLLKSAVLDGNSLRIIHKFTGITPSQITRTLDKRSANPGTDLQ